MEHLNRSLELVVGKGKHVGIGRIGQHHGRLLQRPGQGPDIVPHPGRLLVVELGSGGRHTGFKTLDEPAGVAGHEVAEVLGDHPVLLDADPADARSGALVDVAEQTRSADLRGTFEDTTAAGAQGEDSQQLVERLADCPRLGIGTEVSRPLALGSPHHLSAGKLLTHGDGEVRVGLVVAVLDVEARVELLDPGVLQLQGLDLVGHDCPLDAGTGRDHRSGAGVKRRDVLEVGRQTRAQRLGLADVDDPAIGVAEAVDAGVKRDLPRARAV